MQTSKLIDNSSLRNKTTKICKQNPVCNDYKILSELGDVLKSGFYKSALGYENVDCFADEIINLENKMNFYLENFKKDIILTEEDNKDFENNNFCRFCKKKY